MTYGDADAGQGAKLRSTPTKILRNPIKAFNYGLALLKGYYYRVVYQYLLRRAIFGKNLRIRGQLIIKGPGKVIIGDNVLIEGRGHRVTPFTHSPDAIIQIGANSFINGTRFGCCRNIRIGEFAILGDARIMDTDFHSIWPNRWSSEAEVATRPIIIEDNVWIGGGAAVLKGVHIGSNSVVGFGSIVISNVPSDCIVAGNPARVIKRLADLKAEA
jgi:maltose O-acetyltransferase